MYQSNWVYYSSVDWGGSDPLERIRIESIRESKEKNQYPSSKEENEKKTYLVKIKLLQLLLSSIPQEARAEDILLLREDLKKIIHSFSELKNNDLSQDMDFLLCLSKEWQLLIDHYLPIAHSKNPFVAKIKNFLHEVEEYKLKDSYSMGHYLGSLAGEKWIPYPYMEMLSQLHQQSQQDLSTLTMWIDHLYQILD